MSVHYYTYLDDNEYATVIRSLVNLKNNLLSEGKYTDAVDDLLMRFAEMKKKRCEYATQKDKIKAQITGKVFCNLCLLFSRNYFCVI